METYNDACISITGSQVPQGAELVRRPEFTFSGANLTCVTKTLIPALEKKIEIFQLMEKQHKEASVLATINLQHFYQEMTAAIKALLDRAQLQYFGFKQWIDKQDTNIDMTMLDTYESTAIVRATTALNDLIYKNIGLTFDEWLEIIHESLNFIRASVKLTPLSKDIFRSRYFKYLSGEHTRFFND